MIGFVGCALNTSEYRFFLDATDFSVRLPVHDDARQWLKNPSSDECLRMVARGLFLCEWSTSGIDGSLQTAWAYEKQLDVRYKGAYIERPDFWQEKEENSEE